MLASHPESQHATATGTLPYTNNIIIFITKTQQKNYVDCLLICLTRDVSLSLDINIVHAAECGPDWPVTDLREKQ